MFVFYINSYDFISFTSLKMKSLIISSYCIFSVTDQTLIDPYHVFMYIAHIYLNITNWELQECDLIELESTVEPTWPKLVEPLEKIADPLRVVWGIVNHLIAVKDSLELRSAIEEVQVLWFSLYLNEYAIQLFFLFFLDFLSFKMGLFRYLQWLHLT